MDCAFLYLAAGIAFFAPLRSARWLPWATWSALLLLCVVLSFSYSRGMP